MAKSSREHAVRMLDHAVRLWLRYAEESMSEVANGRLASNLRKDVRSLKKLAQYGPGEIFWASLQKTILKLAKFVRQTRS